MAKTILKKADIKVILDSYSARPDEFEKIGQEGYKYKSCFTRGYHITIEPDTENQRVMVYHSDSRGKRNFCDTWEKDSQGYYFKFRNTAKIPPQDKVYFDMLENRVKELELENEKIKAAARRLKAEYKELELEYRNFDVERIELRRLESENRELKANLKSLKKYTSINETLKRKIGRPKEFEKQISEVEKIKKLLEDGKTNDEIMKLLGMSRAKFFRRKQMI